MSVRDSLTVGGHDGRMNPISAIAGISNATYRFERASQRLLESTSGVSNDDPAEAIVDMVQAKTQFRANIATLRAADDMTATLLDILA